MLKMHEGGGGNLTTEQTACEFLKQQQLVFTGWIKWGEVCSAHEARYLGFRLATLINIAHSTCIYLVYLSLPMNSEDVKISLTFCPTLSVLLGEARCCLEGRARLHHESNPEPKDWRRCNSSKSWSWTSLERCQMAPDILMQRSGFIAGQF